MEQVALDRRRDDRVREQARSRWRRHVRWRRGRYLAILVAFLALVLATLLVWREFSP